MDKISEDCFMRTPFALAEIIIICLLLGCAGLQKSTKQADIYCPKCKVKAVIRHRHIGRRIVSSWLRRHEHVKYICPTCGEEWSGKEDTRKERR